MDYTKKVPRKAPEGMLDTMDERMEVHGLVYSCEWVMDTSPETMLTKPGRKKRAVRVKCSFCKGEDLLDYAPPRMMCHGYGVSQYGFVNVPPEEHVVMDGDNTLCPFCRVPVLVKCASAIGKKGRVIVDEEFAMSASLLSQRKGRSPLVLTEWSICREIDREANEHITSRPAEAYIFEADDAVKLICRHQSYHGYIGYFTAYSAVWRQPQQWSETTGQELWIYGLTKELIEASALPNCKLFEYMEAGSYRRENWKSPVVYLRLYQRYPQIENIVVQGFSHILDGLFDRYLPASKWENNKRGDMTVPEIDWSEKRPAQMLRLNKDEFRMMQQQCWDLYHWEIYLKCREVGDILTQRDITLLHQYGGEDAERVIGRAPLGKCLRYIFEQMIPCADVDEDEFDIEVDAAVDLTTLADYWDMAETAKWDLDSTQVRWPDDLLMAHNMATDAVDQIENRALNPKFKKRFAELSKYAYESGGLQIVPARTQSELKREGKLQHHCVSSYGKRHANGETAIFFIRHVAHPKTPYFTLQFDEKDECVKQNRGKRNRDRTEEVVAFEARWLAWVHAGCPRDKDGKPMDENIAKKGVTA